MIDHLSNVLHTFNMLVCQIPPPSTRCRNLGPEINAGYSFVQLVVSPLRWWVVAKQPLYDALAVCALITTLEQPAYSVVSRL